MIDQDISVIDWLEPLDRPPLQLTIKMARDLVAYAEGSALDPDTEDALDRWLFDYVDRELEDEYIDAADDFEALMRRHKRVAMLVAEKTEEKRLHKRICAYTHDWLYGDEHVEIKRMIESNARLADLVAELREMKPHVEAAFRSLEDEPLSLDLLPIIRSLKPAAMPYHRHTLPRAGGILKD